jgi:hypothetical protein
LITLIGSVGPVQPSAVARKICDIGCRTSQMKGDALSTDCNASELVVRCRVEPSTKPAGSGNTTIGETCLPTSEIREVATVEKWVTDASNDGNVTSPKSRRKPSEARMKVLTLTSTVRS